MQLILHSCLGPSAVNLLPTLMMNSRVLMPARPPAHARSHEQPYVEATSNPTMDGTLFARFVDLRVDGGNLCFPCCAARQHSRAVLACTSECITGNNPLPFVRENASKECLQGKNSEQVFSLLVAACLACCSELDSCQHLVSEGHLDRVFYAWGDMSIRAAQRVGCCMCGTGGLLSPNKGSGGRLFVLAL